MKNFLYIFCFVSSIAVNILFSINWYASGDGGGLWWGEKQQISSAVTLSWSKKAAAEAEAVAAKSCSGHGKAYLDGLTIEGEPACECNDCYGGDDCSAVIPDCKVDVEGGDVTFSEPFWMHHAANTAVLVSGWHRMSYNYNDNTTMSLVLENYIRKLHSQVGNAIVEGRYLVFGVGSAQLLNAAILALSSENFSSPSTVLATIPLYPLFLGQTQLFNSKSFKFGGDTNAWISNNSTGNTDVIELITSPNNPDGNLQKSIIGGKAIYDHVYYWPHLTPIPAPSDQEFSIFSLSKLTGHAGTRLGWAIIKDKKVYDKVMNYIQMAEIAISKETQLRALKILKVIVKEGDGKSFFRFGYQVMSDRWRRLTSVFSKSTRFSLQKTQPWHCNFFNKTREPFPAFAWVKCEREEDEDCDAVLQQEGNIIGHTGGFFLAKERYVRLSITKTQANFDLLMQRLTKLISLENATIKPMRMIK